VGLAPELIGDKTLPLVVTLIGDLGETGERVLIGGVAQADGGN
jgi:hypothetical protein